MSNSKKVIVNSQTPIFKSDREELDYETARLAKMETRSGKAKMFAEEFKSDSSKKYYILFAAVIAAMIVLHYAGKLF